MHTKNSWGDSYNEDYWDYKKRTSSKNDYEDLYDIWNGLVKKNDDSYIKGMTSKKEEEIQFLEISKNLLYLEDKPINEFIKDINDFKTKLKNFKKCTTEEVIMLYGYLIKNYNNFSEEEKKEYLEKSVLKYVKNNDISTMLNYIYKKNLDLIDDKKIIKSLENINSISNENKKDHIEYKQTYYFIKNNFNKLTSHQKNNFITKYKIKSRQHISLLNLYVENNEIINYGLLSNLSINNAENKQIVFDYIQMILDKKDIDSIKYFAKNCYHMSKDYLKFHNDNDDILLKNLFNAYPYEFYNENKNNANFELNKLLENYTQEYLIEYNSIINDIKKSPDEIEKYKKLYNEKIDIKEIKSLILLHLYYNDQELAKLYYNLDISKIQKSTFNYNNLIQNEILTKSVEYKNMIPILIENINIVLNPKYKNIYKEIIDNKNMENIKLNKDLFDIMIELLPYMNKEQQKQYILSVENRLVSKLYDSEIKKVKIDENDLNQIILSLSNCNSEVFNNIYEYHILPNYNFLKDEHLNNKNIIEYLDKINLLINKAKLNAELSSNEIGSHKKKISKI